MPWQVKAFASDPYGRRFKTVLEIEDVEALSEEDARMIMYWVRYMEPGEEVVIRRFEPGETG